MDVMRATSTSEMTFIEVTWIWAIQTWDHRKRIRGTKAYKRIKQKPILPRKKTK